MTEPTVVVVGGGYGGVNTAKAALNGLNTTAGANSVVFVKFVLDRPFTVSKVSWAATISKPTSP